MSTYESDFYGWVTEQANLLKSGRLNELDTANLLEEIEGMGKSEKRALENRLAVLLQHLLKWHIAQINVTQQHRSRACSSPHHALHSLYSTKCVFGGKIDVTTFYQSGSICVYDILVWTMGSTLYINA
jgi:hypothetical protein